ncbi:MAG TPA: dTMP kinase [Chthoniobacterales bacterium]|jgi:dTMP kinase|nr:dTMP kinase [Chthoniobacterales bacterium]
MAGIFVTFEGVEACGKSTQVKRLKRRLEAVGRKVIAVHEPGFTEIGSAIRHLLLHAKEGNTMQVVTELLLFEASRAQLVAEVIRPSLAKDNIVLSDRFYDSTTVYQGIARGLDSTFVRMINEFVVEECKPVLTILLDIDIETSLIRQMRRVRPVGVLDRMERLPAEFFEKVRLGYLETARAEPDRIKIVEASRAEDCVEREIWDCVDALLG